LKRYPPLTPMAMRTRRHERKPVELNPPDSSRLPPLASESDTDAAVDATIDWLAHVAAGRIQVR